MKKIKIIGVLVVMFLSYSSIAQPWEFNPEDYEFTMNVTGQVKIDGNITNLDNAYLGAFVNDECRGYALATEHNGNYKNYLLTIYSNTSSGENVTFKWVNEQGEEFTIANTINYYTDSIICSLDNPFLFMDQEDYSSTDFLTFSVDSQITSATIDANTKTINVLVSENTDLTTIIPKFTIAPAAVAYIGDVLQESELTENDFSSDVVYTVKGIDGNTANWTVTISLDDNAVAELSNDNSFSIYPNPATNNVQLVTKELLSKNTSVLIYDAYGKIVYSTVIASEAWQSLSIDSHEQSSRYDVLTIDVSTLPKGVYFIKVGNVTRKFVKE